MTVVNTETGELSETLTGPDARRLTDRIRLLGGSLADTLDKMAELIDQARTGSAWLALGYRSWTEYVSNEFADVLPRLDREPRQEFVRELASHGMSTRAIAPVVGASQATVRRDVATESDDSVDEEPTPIVGLNGKTYLRSVAFNHAALAEAAVADFPDLAYFRDLGQVEHCWRLADTLRSFDPGERVERINTLRRSIELDRSKRDGTYRPAIPPVAQTCPTCGQNVRN